MASERITAWLRVRDKLRFIRDMHAAADSVQDLGNAEERAAIKAKLFSREQRKAAINSAFLKDHLSLTRGELMTTALTIAGYTAPALVALGSSAAAAAIGGGVVAGGGLAALTAGLSGFSIVGMQAFKMLGNVNTAQKAYNVAIAQYGQGSKQAATASAHLWAVIQQNGGLQVWNLARAWTALGKAWRTATAPTRKDFFSLMATGIGRIRNLMPTFAAETNKNSAVIRRDLGDLFVGISGNEVKRNIKDFSSIFRNMSPHISRGFLNIFLVIGRVLRQAAPWAVEWARAFESTTESWRRGTRDGLSLGDTIDGLVGHTKAWWGLIKSVAHLLLTFFKASNSSGKGLVISLTAVTKQFDSWLMNAQKTGDVTRFFQEFANALREIARLIAPILVIVGTLATGMLPILKSSSGQVNDALWIMARNVHFVVSAIQFLGPLVGPLIDLWIAWKVVTVAQTVAIWAANLALGVLAGEIFAIMIVLAAVAGAFYLAYVKVGWFHNAVDATVRFIKQNWPGIVATLAAGPIGTALYLMYTKFRWFRDAVNGVISFVVGRIRDFISFMKRVPGALGGKGGGLLGNVLGRLPGIGPILKIAGGFAGGGTIPSGMSGLVGESGPEIASVGPSGTQISPLGRSHSTGAPSPINWPEIDGVVHVHVHSTLKVDRRVVATAYDEVKSDKQARRGEKR